MIDDGFPPSQSARIGRQGAKAGSTNLSKSFLMRLDRGEMLDLPNMPSRQNQKFVPIPEHMEKYQVLARAEDMQAIRAAALASMTELIINQKDREASHG